MLLKARGAHSCLSADQQNIWMIRARNPIRRARLVSLKCPLISFPSSILAFGKMELMFEVLVSRFSSQPGDSDAGEHLEVNTVPLSLMTSPRYFLSSFSVSMAKLFRNSATLKQCSYMEACFAITNVRKGWGKNCRHEFQFSVRDAT